jgi:hypothetical protein
VNAYSARIAMPGAAHPYWRELLLRCGLEVEPLGSGALDPAAVLLPDAAGLGSFAELRQLRRLRGRGVPIVAGAEWGAMLLGGRVRKVAAFGLGGLGSLSADAACVRMPVRVLALELATLGRIWPSGARAALWSSDPAPLCVLALARADELLAAGSELVAFACGEDRVASEIVSAVDHGALRRLVLGALLAATKAAGRALVRKSGGALGPRRRVRVPRRCRRLPRRSDADDPRRPARGPRAGDVVRRRRAPPARGRRTRDRGGPGPRPRARDAFLFTTTRTAGAPRTSSTSRARSSSCERSATP